MESELKGELGEQNQEGCLAWGGFLNTSMVPASSSHPQTYRRALCHQPPQ